MYDYLSTYTSINNIYNTLTFIASIGVFVAPMPFSILFIELVISENLENHTAIEVQPIVQIENVTCNSEYIISYDFIPSIILEWIQPIYLFLEKNNFIGFILFSGITTGAYFLLKDYLNIDGIPYDTKKIIKQVQTSMHKEVLKKNYIKIIEGKPWLNLEKNLTFRDLRTMKFYSEIYDSLFISTKENLILLEINEIFKKKVIPLLMEKKVPNFSYNFYLNTLKKNVCGFLVDNIVGKLVQGEYITPNKALQSTLNLDVLIIIQSLNKDALAKDVVNQTMYSSKIIKNIL